MNNIVGGYLKQIVSNEVNEENIDKILYESMGGDDIKYYFSKAKIMTIPELKKYKNIYELMPNKKDYCFLLYEHKKDYGHWVLIIRNNNNLEYFDSYGGKIDGPINWITKEQQNKLDVKPYLTQLINNTPNLSTEYNGVDFQNKKNKDISTCGRHCCLRLKTFLNNDFDLDDYIDFMKEIKKKSKLSYDDIVSEIINKI